jgi:Skp family chaperone for outer membrane proteins
MLIPVLSLVLAATFGQTPQTTQTPAKPAPAAAQAPAAPIVAAFPPDAKVAFVNMPAVFSASQLGKAGQAKFKSLADQLTKSLNDKNTAITALTDKIKAQQGVAAEAIVAGWNSELAKMQRDLQFAQQEAQAESDQLQQSVLADFSQKVQPVVEALRAEKGLWIVFSLDAEQSGLSVAAIAPGLDLSAEVIKRLDGAK